MASKQYKVDSLLKLVTKPQYKPKRTLLSIIIQKIGVRKIIFFVLLLFLFILIALRIYYKDYSSIIDNILAGLIGSIITIYIIDFLLNYDRKIRLQAINARNNDFSLLAVRGLMANILFLFEKIGYEELKKLLYGIPDNKFKKLLSNKKLIFSRINKLTEFDEKNLRFIINLGLFLDMHRKLEDLLQGYTPYIDPVLEYKIKYESNKFISAVTLTYLPLTQAFPNSSTNEFDYRPRFKKSVSWKTPEEAYLLLTQPIIRYPNKTAKEFIAYCKMLEELAEKAEHQTIPIFI